MQVKQVDIEKLASFIEYAYEGLNEYPFQAFIDDKGSEAFINRTNYQEVLDTKVSYWDLSKISWNYWDYLNPSNLRDGLPVYIKRCELEKRAFCFYMNGSMYLDKIKKIRFHFVDIDSGGGTKEEQLERIMNAPLKPTIIYEGRAGYKLLYEVKDAYWDTSTQQTFDKSKYIFEKIQLQLISYFKGDSSKFQANNCFRLPYVNNYKEWSSDGKVYQEKIIYWEPSNVYTQQQLADAFPPGEEPKKAKKVKLYDVSDQAVQEIIEVFTDNLDVAGLDYTNYRTKIAYQCPVHNDGNASAYIFFDSLICHCSNGQNGECEIENGKPLSWLAKHQGWDDLLELALRLEAKPAEKYEKITLDQLQTFALTPLLSEETKWNPVVKEVVANITATMKSRNITVDKASHLIYSNLVTSIHNTTPGVTVWPLEPGGGKTTTFITYLKYMLKHHIDQAGTIIVVERNETAIALAKELGKYRMCFEATERTASEVDWCEPLDAAYVMQSAYTYKKCKKTLTSYEHNVCGRCSFKSSCDLPKKYEIQKRFPIVIMTHARLQMEGEKLSNYAKWRTKDGKLYERKRIIIDEKPPITDVIQISTEDIDMFKYDLKSMELEIGSETMLSALNIVNKLKETMLSSERGIPIPALDTVFKFSFESEWYKYYEGSNVSLLKHVEAAITQEGVVNEYNKRITYTTAKKVVYDFSHYNVVILDGTAKYDLEYGYLNNVQVMDVPTLKTYDHLTLYYDTSIPSSKQRLHMDIELKNKLVKFVKEKSLDKPVLVLCYQFLRKSLESLFAKEIKANKIAVNHFGNVKGSNDYLQYSCLVVVGIINKGDAYYLCKSGAIFEEGADLELTTIKSVRRFNNTDIEKYKLSDQVVSSIQDILRINIRNKGEVKQSAEVYVFSRDTVFLNLLLNYFIGSKAEHWNLLESKPKWFDKVNQLFESLEPSEKITKASIREMLSLEGAAGKKQLQRIMQSEEFHSLLTQHNIVKVNTRQFVKQGSTNCYTELGSFYRGLKAIARFVNG